MTVTRVETVSAPSVLFVSERFHRIDPRGPHPLPTRETILAT